MARNDAPTSADRASFRSRLAFLNRLDRSRNTGNLAIPLVAVVVVDVVLAVLDDRPARLLLVAVVAVVAAVGMSYSLYPLRRFVRSRAVASTVWVVLLAAGFFAGIGVTVRAIGDERTTFAWFLTYLAVPPATGLLDAAVPALFALRFPRADGDGAGRPVGR